MSGRLTQTLAPALTWATIGWGAVLALALGVGSEVAARAAVQAEAAAIAREVASDIDGQTLQSLQWALPEARSVERWDTHGTALTTLHGRLANAVAAHSLTRARTVQPAPHADGRPGEGSAPIWDITVSSSESPRWRSTIEGSQAMAEAWQSGQAHEVGAAAGSRVVRHFSRIEDNLGRPVALLEVARPMGSALAFARGVALAVFILAAMPALLVSAGVRRAIRLADADLRRLRAQVAAWTGEGLFTAWEKPPPPLSPQLANALEKARSDAADRLNAVHQQLEQAQAALASAEAVLDPDGVVRRRALAELALGPCLTIASGERFDTVELVDLCFDYVVVRASRYTMVDVAPGMPIAVGWPSHDSSQVLRVERRIEREGEIDYVCRVSPPRMLPGTPATVSRVTYVRKAVRVECGGEVSATVLAGETGSLSAEVLDLSVAGCALRIATTPENLALTGTSIMLQLKLGREGVEYSVVVQIRSVSARPGGCDVGCAIDADATPNFADLKIAITTWTELRKRAMLAGNEAGAARAA